MRSPGFACAAIVSMALGIGANAAIFSLVNAVLLKTLPVNDPASLILIARKGDEGRVIYSFPHPLLRDLRTSDGVLDVIGVSGAAPSVDLGDRPERVSAEMISGNYFTSLGVKPFLGRLFTDADDRVPGGHPVVVLSHAYWLRRFGGDRGVIGRTIHVNTHPMTIVGVTPPGFYGTDPAISPDLRVPVAMQAEVEASRLRLNNPREWWLSIIARVRPGVSRPQATEWLQAKLDAFVPATNPEDRAGRILVFDGSQGRGALRDRFRMPLIVLMMLVGVVLLLVCANLANLMLARASARHLELSVRRALGAGRIRILRQLIVEAVLLSAVGGAAGFVLAIWGARWLLSIALPPTGALDIGPGVSVLMFTAGVSAVTAILCGLAPGLSSGSAPLVGALRSEARSVAGGRLHGRKGLMAAQVALSLTVLVGAGLFLRTLTNLRTMGFGFETESLAMLTLNPMQSGYSRERARSFYDQAASEVSRLPGVRAASFAVMGLLSGGAWGSGLTLDTGEHDDRPGPDRNAVGPGYFATVGIRLREGRDFDVTDTAASMPVAIVNETFARRYFKGGPALGRRIGPGGPQGTASYTVIGVASDSKRVGVRDDPSPSWFIPYAQLPFGVGPAQFTLHVRTVGPPDGVIDDVRRAIGRIDRNVTVFRVQTMRQQIEQQVRVERLLAVLGVFFGVVALLLAAIGLYGVVTYITSARIRELGLRIALGASRWSILRLVLGQTIVLIAAGVVIGLALTYAAVGYVRSLLYGVEPTDPATLVRSVVLIVTITTLAALLPAARATRVDPVRALQN
jgi:predicted permease